MPFSPGEDCVVVANDWHTAMFPVLLKVLSPFCTPCCFMSADHVPANMLPAVR